MKLQALYRTTIFVIAVQLVSLPVPAQSIALLKDDHVQVQDAAGLVTHRIDDDDRPKSMLRWNAAKKVISYMVPAAGPEKARFVMISPDGRVIGERVLRPDPAEQGLRFVESFDWLANGNARVDGSVNPRNCSAFEFDPDTQMESKERFGACGTEVMSPDAKYLAWLGPTSQTDEAHQYNTVDIDLYDFPADCSYAGGGHDIFVLSGPVWDPANEKVAILEKRADTGEIAVVTIKADKAWKRVPLTRKLGDSITLAWTGRYIILSDGGDPIPIDTQRSKIVPYGPDVENEIIDHASKQGGDPAHKAAIDARIGQLGGSEAVELTNWP